MFGYAAIGAFLGALIMQLIPASEGRLFNPATFTIIGLLCLAIHLSTSWGHRS